MQRSARVSPAFAPPRPRRVQQARPRRRPGRSRGTRFLTVPLSLLVLTAAGYLVAAAAGVTHVPFVAPAGEHEAGPGGPDVRAIAVEASGRPSASPAPSGGVTAAGTTRTPSPAPSTRPKATPRPSPSAAPVVTGPVSATPPPGFHLERTVVEMGFPVPRGFAYRYRDNFLDPRVGEPRTYNHVLGRRADGSLRRAHDGVDIYVAIGTPVQSPFAGVVIDPAKRWKPWHHQRYGVVAAVMSTEPKSRGYVALLVHLARLDVRPGDRVTRGERLGTLGRSGNADNPGVVPHIHFELRAPFRIRLREAGTVRLLDAFNPYPSLRAADPKVR